MDNQDNIPNMNKLKAFATSPDLAIFEELRQLNEAMSKANKVLENLDLSEVDSIKGDSPEKGKDYFTDDELEQIKEIVKAEVMPVKGVHYFDGETPDIDEIVEKVLEKLNNK